MVSQLLVSRNCLFSRNEVAAVGGRGVEGGGVKRKKRKKKCERELRPSVASGGRLPYAARKQNINIE